MLMPCRHVFKCRLVSGLVVFDQSLVVDRWLKQYQIHVGECTENNQDDDNGDLSNEAQRSSVLSTSFLCSTLAHNQKYHKILSLTNKLAVLTSQCGMPEFREKYATVESLVHLSEENVPFTIVPITDPPNSTGNKQFHVGAVKIILQI